MSSQDRPADVLAQRGLEAHNAGHYDEAARGHDASATAYMAAGNLRAASGQRLEQADSLLAAGEPDEALASARLAFDLAQQVDDALLTGEACYLSARALIRLDRADEALTCCAEGLAHYANAELDPGVRLTALMEFEVSLGDYIRARSQGQSAVLTDLAEAPPIGYIPNATWLAGEPGA